MSVRIMYAKSMKASVWESVGNTALIKIKSLSEMTGCEIYGKAEFQNPGGSVKDRAAKGIIRAAEASGRLKPGGVIVDGTAGNTGISLATLGAERGYRVILSMPNNQSSEKYEILRALGAELHLVEPCPFVNPQHFYHTAKRVAASTPGAFWADQFENTSNCDFHYETTGAEIWNDLGGEIDFFTCAAGTGGTISGVSRYLREKKRDTKIILADPNGSGLCSYLKTGEIKTEGTSVTEGIGIMRLTENFKKAQVDDAITISDEQMIDMIYHIAKEDGLLLGTSAALNLYSAYLIAKKHHGTGKTIATILCDHGTRYVSRIFNANWLREKKLTPKSLE